LCEAVRWIPDQVRKDNWGWGWITALAGMEREHATPLRHCHVFRNPSAREWELTSGVTGDTIMLAVE